MQILSCGNSDSIGIFISPRQLAVDSTNNRLFVAETSKGLLAFVASTFQDLTEIQPIVSEEENTAIYDLLPNFITKIVTYIDGDITRFFVFGSYLNSNGNTVLNRIRVIDFDGVAFTEASFSPINLSDGDGTTDERDNSFADMIVDQDNAVLYITDASQGMLYAISTIDGSTVAGPFSIAGHPQGLSLDGERLYVCNSSDVDLEKVITVVNISDYSMTKIDINATCDFIGVQSNDSGTVLVAKDFNEQIVYVRLVDNTTFASSSAINSASGDFPNGYISARNGITSSIGGLAIAKDSIGDIHAYFSELDGNIEFMSLSNDLSSYTLDTLSTTSSNITQGVVYKDSSGVGLTAYFVADTGTVLSIEFGTENVTIKK